MAAKGQISENSRRIAKNTLLLYFRMFLLMLIGLYTSRVVLSALGIEDFGVYGAVGDVVAGFTFITASLSAAISRYMAHGLGKSDPDRLKRVFSTGVLIQLAFALLMVILVESVGTWMLYHKLQIPDGRMTAAGWVLQCSLGVLVLNLLSVPYNATIIAHERMGAFALISFIEACLALLVALLLKISPVDKLQSYAVLMLAVSLIIRLCYGFYCHRHFEESRGRLVFDRSLIREMTGFAGWNYFGSSAYVFNTRVVNVVVNIFFGVTMNAARLVALKVEGLLKQFVSNFLTALNPQITKSWASGDREYCFELVRKGAKYTFWMLLIMFIPLLVWTRPLLVLWLTEARVPESAPLFTRLAIVALMVDMTGNTLVTLVQATGKVRRYYIVTGLVSYLCLPLVWLAFKLGAPAYWAYLCFIIVYSAVFALKLLLLRAQTGFPIGRFFRSFFTVTDGERAFILRKTARFMPDRMFLRWKYRVSFGRRLNLRKPERFTEKIQWLKLNDHRAIYHKMADKLEVKKLVAERIGPEYVIPTIWTCDSALDIDMGRLPERFAVKCTHDSGSTVVCPDKASFDHKSAFAKLDAALKVDFYKRDREWVYKGLKPHIIIEKYLGEDVRDYKFFCFGGKPRFFKIDFDRFSGHRANYYDLEGQLLPYGEKDFLPDPERELEIPRNLGRMVELAAKLSAGTRFLRVDFYDIDGKIWFGELTFYPNSGFREWLSDEQDIEIGKLIEL